MYIYAIVHTTSTGIGLIRSYVGYCFGISTFTHSSFLRQQILGFLNYNLPDTLPFPKLLIVSNFMSLLELRTFILSIT